ncbi:MAG: type IV secretory system conjugative DNA transfer family protein [Mobilitalea sp.]
MANKKSASKPDAFSRLAKEVKDLTGLNIQFLKDKKVRMRLVKHSIPYVLFGYVGNLLGYSYRMSSAKDIIGKIMDTINSISEIVTDPMPSFHWQDLLIGIAVGIGMKLIVYIKGRNAKKYRKGKEYGSAELGGPKDIEPFINREQPDQNLIFSQTELMSMAGRMESPLYNRNKNVLIIGGSGSGKTRFYAKPNLMQLNCSYVFTDPKGQVLEECGHLLKINGYKIKVLNTINFKKSMHYNPFAYIHCEADVMKVADALIEGTTIGKQQGEQFWIDAERLLYNALIGYIWCTGVEEEKNFSTFLDMVNAMEIREEDDEFKNAVDYMFEELEEKNPENYALLQYKKFKQAAGKTAKSIMISVGARLARFDIAAVRKVMEYDEMGLDELGDEKCALFLITSDTTKTFNFMATILYTQLFNLLCEKADNIYRGRLPVHVHCIMDEFANLGRIPDWEILISTIRSREISASIILQSMAQLKSIYDKQADIISDNCDTLLFLGGKGRDTLKEISELLGKETIDLYNTSDTRGNSPSYGTNYQKTGRELFTPDELARLPGDKCIVQIKGVKPFYSNKYDIEKHPRYKFLADFNQKNFFNIEKELTIRVTMKPVDTVEYFNAGLI